MKKLSDLMCCATLFGRTPRLPPVGAPRPRQVGPGRLWVTVAPLLYLVATPYQASATDYYWVCGTSSWCSGNCWSPAGPPSGDNKAVIDNGGTATVPSNCQPDIRYVYLGRDSAGASGHVSQGGDNATIEVLYVGYRGSGSYFIDQPRVLHTDEIQLGNRAGSYGSFTQNPNTLVYGYDPDTDLYVAYVRIGAGTECGGDYYIHDARLRAATIRIGYASGCTGTLTQNGGIVYNNKDSGSYLRLGQGYTSAGIPGRGTYTMNDDAALYSTKIHTFSGVATFNQNDSATVTIYEDLALVCSRDDDGPALATYNLESGYLSADTEYIGQADGGPSSVATFNHNLGGTNEVNYLYIGYGAGSNGTYYIPIGADAVVHAGELHVGLDGHGVLDIDDPACTITISHKLSFGVDGELHIAPEEPRFFIWMNGASFDNHCTSEVALADLIYLELAFGCAETVVSDLEVAGEDKGCAELQNNFALGHLRVGAADSAYVCLVDNIDNGNRGGVGGSAEALYVADLTLNAGSTLDLNGLHLYCEAFTDNGGTVLNGTVRLLGAPVVTQEPDDQTACWGGSATFSVVAGGTPPLQYQWRRGTTPLYDDGHMSGAQTATLIIAPVGLADAADNYNCVVTNGCGSDTSDPAALTVYTPPAILEHPESQTVCVGDPVTFTVVVDQGLPPQYQWRRDGIDIDGATQSSYAIDPVVLGDAADYDVVVTNQCGTVASDPATLTVETCCAGDLDGDGDTDQADLGILLADWNCGGGGCGGDLDGDGDTDQSDLGILLADWGCGVQP